jgi:hypothetical protein
VSLERERVCVVVCGWWCRGGEVIYWGILHLAESIMENVKWKLGKLDKDKRWK